MCVCVLFMHTQCGSAKTSHSPSEDKSVNLIAQRCLYWVMQRLTKTRDDEDDVILVVIITKLVFSITHLLPTILTKPHQLGAFHCVLASD